MILPLDRRARDTVMHHSPGSASGGHRQATTWQRTGWERHDLMIEAVAGILFPFCLASEATRRTGDTGVWRRASARARSSAAMIAQLPG